jgi:hypothetical protein
MVQSYEVGLPMPPLAVSVTGAFVSVLPAGEIETRSGLLRGETITSR